VIYYLRHWKNTAFLLWHIKTLRGYLQSILAISEEPHARILAAAALAHTRDEHDRLIEP
jgi:hypothetical protein